MEVQFVEWPSYSKRRDGRITDDEHIELEEALRKDPRKGTIERETGGIRKIRVRRVGAGKSRGFRVIYYFVSGSKSIHLLDIYSKGEKDSLTAKQKGQLKKILSLLK